MADPCALLEAAQHGLESFTMVALESVRSVVGGGGTEKAGTLSPSPALAQAPYVDAAVSASSQQCASHHSRCIAFPNGARRQQEGQAPAVSSGQEPWRTMAWSSLLPEHLSSFETLIARLFVGLPDWSLVVSTPPGAEPSTQIIFGFVTIGPWLLLIVYDLVLYCCRTVTYELPIVGGRARGKRRPRAPSLTERPSGQRRQLNPILHSNDEHLAHASGSSQPADPDAFIRHRDTAVKEDH